MWGLTCSRSPSFKHGTFEPKENKARQRKAKQDQAWQSKAKQGKVGQSKAQQGRAKPRKAKKQLFGIQCIHFQKLVFECCVLGFCLELVLKLNSQARTQQPTTVRDSCLVCAACTGIGCSACTIGPARVESQNEFQPVAHEFHTSSGQRMPKQTEARTSKNSFCTLSPAG